MKAFGLLMVLFFCLSAGTVTMADDNQVASGYEPQAEQAKALLEKATARYREIGDAAFAEISRQGPFTTADLYVYVTDTRGTMLASGGQSAIYIGRDINNLLSTDLKAAYIEILAQPESGIIHSQEYRWMNWKDGKVERKRAYYQRIGELIFAAGYYMPRSSASEAERLLDDVIAALIDDPTATLTRINKLDPYFNRDDLYAFVVDPATTRIVAHGMDRRLAGSDFRDLKAANGQHIGKQMLEVIEGKTQARGEYSWRNPVTGKIEAKYTVLKRAAGYLVAVGYYAAKPE